MNLILRYTNKKKYAYHQPTLMRTRKKGPYFTWLIFKTGSYRHGVEEQSHESHQQSNDKELNQAHLVVIPQKVLQGLERVHEPRER